MSKVILLTGGTGGLGRSAAKKLLSEGHTVIISGRSEEKREQAIKWINPSDPKRLHTFILDLESLLSMLNSYMIYTFQMNLFLKYEKKIGIYLQT